MNIVFWYKCASCEHCLHARSSDTRRAVKAFHKRVPVVESLLPLTGLAGVQKLPSPTRSRAGPWQRCSPCLPMDMEIALFPHRKKDSLTFHSGDKSLSQHPQQRQEPLVSTKNQSSAYLVGEHLAEYFLNHTRPIYHLSVFLTAVSAKFKISLY